MNPVSINGCITVVDAVILTILYVIICDLFTGIINRIVWRKLSTKVSAVLNLLTHIIFSGLFIYGMAEKYQLSLNIFVNITPVNVFLAFACAIAFYLLLYKFIDRILDSLFPTSAKAYQEAMAALSKNPFAAFIRVCLLGPVVEEIVMRGFVLSGLRNTYGVLIALIVSALLFALIHFNFVQTISALICGLVLGALYICTNSLFCCILAHFLYNSIQLNYLRE